MGLEGIKLKPEKMDLHIHTSHGDKKYLTPEEILQRAKQNGIH